MAPKAKAKLKAMKKALKAMKKAMKSAAGNSQEVFVFCVMSCLAKPACLKENLK